MITCFCRTFAVGYCADCAQAVCGVHSSLATGVRLCGSCEEARTPAGQARRAQAAERAVEGHDRRLREVGAVSDPIERLVSAVRFVLHDLRGLHPHDQVPAGEGRTAWNPGLARERMRDELARTCPEFCGEIDPSAFEGERRWVGRWSSDEVGAWLAKRWLAAGHEPGLEYSELQERKRILRQPRWVRVATHRGWRIGGGSGSRLLLTDGRCCETPSNWEGLVFRGPPKAEPLELRHLDAIADLLGLPQDVEIATSYPI